MNQTHNDKGDNVINKFVGDHFNLTNESDLLLSYENKLKQINKSKDINLEDNSIKSALKEVIKNLIEQEEQKSHGLVPIARLKDKFKTLFTDEQFILLLRELKQENIIDVTDAQICFVQRRFNDKIQI